MNQRAFGDCITALTCRCALIIKQTSRRQRAVGALARSVNVSVRVDDQADIAQTARGWRVLIAGMIALSRDVIVRGALIVEQTVTLHAQ